MSAACVFAASLCLFLVAARRRCSKIRVVSIGASSLVTAGFAAVLHAQLDHRFGVAYAVLIAALIVGTYTDLHVGYVFDDVTFGAAAMLVICAAVHGTILASLEGALAGAAPFGAIYAATRGRGVGLGDLKLAAVIGLGLGTLLTLASIGYAFVTGAVWTCAALALRTHRREASIPFAPFLSLGVGIVSMVPEASTWLIG